MGVAVKEQGALGPSHSRPDGHSVRAEVPTPQRSGHTDFHGSLGLTRGQPAWWRRVRARDSGTPRRASESGANTWRGAESSCLTSRVTHKEAVFLSKWRPGQGT